MSTLIQISSSGGASFGKFGIADSNGVYTYYSTLQAAITAASAGQTVEFFTDYTETGAVTVTLKNGVNINGNGHTYISSSASTHIVFTDNNVSVKCNINNLIVRKTGAVAVDVGNLTINMINSGSEFNCTSSSFYSKSKIGDINGKLIGGYYEGVAVTFGNVGIFTINTNAYVADISARMLQVTLSDPQYSAGISNEGYIQNVSILTHSSRGLWNNNGGIAKNVSVVSTNNSTGLLVSAIHNLGSTLLNCSANALNIAIYSQGGTIENCAGYSSSLYGLYLDSSANALNSTGVSSAQIGLYCGGFSKVNNCSAYSASLFGIAGSGEFSNCVGESASYLGIGGFTTEVFRNCTSISTSNIGGGYGALWANCTIESRWNNASGHAFSVEYGACTLVNCTLKVANASANCIYLNSPKTIKYAQNSFIGATTPINANITQGMINTDDAYGNITV